VGLYELGTGRRLFSLDGNGVPVGQGVMLSQPIQVRRAEASPLAGEVEMRERVKAAFGGQISLVGYDLNPAGHLWPPNFLHLTLFWQAEGADLEDLQISVRLRDEQGAAAAQIGGRPADGYYPTPDWLAGEFVRDQHSFWLAEDFRPGGYTVEISVSEAQSGAPLIPTRAGTAGDRWLFLTQVEVRRP
jgi:hypothetical protein